MVRGVAYKLPAHGGWEARRSLPQDVQGDCALDTPVLSAPARVPRTEEVIATLPASQNIVKYKQ